MADRRSLSPRARLRREKRERASGKLQFDAESLRGKEHRERVHCKVAAGRAETIGQPMAADFRLHDGMVRANRHAHQLRVGFLMFAEARSVTRGRGLGMGKETLIFGDVAIEDCNASLDKAGKNLRLGVGDVIQAFEIFEMNRGYCRYDRDMRTHHRGKRCDFALVVHADFVDSEPCMFRHSRQGERHAPMIVV